MDTPIKALIIDDSLFMCKALSEILESDSQLKVVGTARDGLDGLEKIKVLQPDVVVLDIDMPRMNGLAAIRHIMIRYCVPIVVFSSLFNFGDVTLEALELGVIDFIPKPSGMVLRKMRHLRKQITDRVKIASGVNIDTIRRVKIKSALLGESTPSQSAPPLLNTIICIGAGFGGTNSVIRLISQLSPNLDGAIIALIEMSPKILPSFIEKFNVRMPRHIAAAEDGQRIRPGACYIGSNENTIQVDLKKNNTPCIRLGGKTAKPLNTLFKSSAEIFNLNTIGVMLTGPGDDGVDGFSHIRAFNGVTIAHNTGYCVRPNLTQNAVDFGVVTHAVDEDRLPEVIENSLAIRVNSNDRPCYKGFTLTECGFTFECLAAEHLRF